MATTLIGIGPYRLGLDNMAPDEIERSFEYRWEPQNRIGRRPAMQFLGPGEETVTLHGVIYPHYYGGFGQLERMRQEAARGIPRGVVSGYGRYHGLWCIRGIRDVQSYFLPSGAARKVEFDIELVAYGPDGARF